MTPHASAATYAATHQLSLSSKSKVSSHELTDEFLGHVAGSAVHSELHGADLLVNIPGYDAGGGVWRRQETAFVGGLGSTRVGNCTYSMN